MCNENWCGSHICRRHKGRRCALEYEGFVVIWFAALMTFNVGFLLGCFWAGRERT